MLKEKKANTEPLTNSAHHSKPFFTGRRQSRRWVGVGVGVSDRRGADWTEKAGLKESLKEGSNLISKLRAKKKKKLMMLLRHFTRSI